tara:strand:- start:314 stop:775 length:462 start_codon:yes stop_codon:yes gene_type:complete
MISFEKRMIKNSENLFNNKKYVPFCIGLVSELMGVSLKEMKVSRVRDRTLARHLLHYALRSKTTLTLEEIGKITNKNHATVIHSVRYINDASENDVYISTLKNCIDNEKASPIFASRNLFTESSIVNRSVPVRVEEIIRIVLKNIGKWSQDKI